MLEKQLMLENFEDVKKFVEITNSKDYPIELLSGKYIINAKSIMGIFSLDLTKPIGVNLYTDDADEITEELKPYIV